MTRIRTRRLVLRPLAQADLDWVTRAAGDIAVSRWLTRVAHPYTRADAEQFLAAVMAGDLGALWIITEAGAPCGIVSVGEELGYWLEPRVWGRGLATEAASAAIRAAFSDPDRQEIRSGHLEGNAGSRRVLEKLGFEDQGSRMLTSLALGTEVASRAMCLTRTKWEAAFSDLSFRELGPDDAADLHQIACHWDVTRQLGSWPWPADPVFTATRSGPFKGEGFVWGVFEAGRLLGTVAVTVHAGLPTLGYMYALETAGRGLATRAARHALSHGFAQWDWPEIHAATWHDNAASGRVLRKLGFVHWRTGYEPARARGVPTLGHDYRLTRTDWDRLSNAAH
ncbi:GNAT family N-acetyltransferase [Ponticoccus sp. SC6-69]|nr:GNAT family N-acetyltransferase [Ponticoccus sp. SC6-38]MBM1246644.1 GNAT family N-acetyltransferase [Ponticoccus sp. SC6-42]MBM1259445.1 GNAT family N-acetyltransferase [Ponticoccus sp. SC6-31]MBM1268768.1 GNAT family N-acetyltransferase [Ponticoccus sp. SC2-37]MBM1273644.1 GNAT family N-acetyltransferase [Ponticoccus sp. SC6-56]MBM1278164.1 GNAT family N-acetyltransferase [Ponticoccus sp. SC6-36]MBM1287180.1 GNAT family N-acetyltransferase [Ponticoccus sp. SC6-69]MBM1300612.1 GNAT famil